MNIQKLTITQEELNEAVGQWLFKKGIAIPVERCSRQYSWGDYEVDLKKEVKKSAPLPPNPVDAVIQVMASPGGNDPSIVFPPAQ